MDSEILFKYFPTLDARQRNSFEALEALYAEWNARINVVSRKDIDNLYERHVLHSLAIAQFLGSLAPGTRIVDVGTGGGFPGIPLAIVYPDVHFHLVDRIAKKLRVAAAVAEAVGLKNVTFQHGDMGECHELFDYAVSRAVMRLDELVKIVRRNISTKSVNALANGLICLKGGDIADESKGIPYSVMEIDITNYFKEDFFETKKIVYVPMF